MLSPFVDKNGNEICTGDVIRYTDNIRTGTTTRTVRRKRESYAVYSDVEIVGVVRFGLFDLPIEGEIATFFVETGQQAAWDSYFFCMSNRDRPAVHVDNLSQALSTEIAGKSEVLIPKETTWKKSDN